MCFVYWYCDLVWPLSRSKKSVCKYYFCDDILSGTTACSCLIPVGSWFSHPASPSRVPLTGCLWLTICQVRSIHMWRWCILHQLWLLANFIALLYVTIASWFDVILLLLRFHTLLRPSVSYPICLSDSPSAARKNPKLSLSSLRAILYDELGVSLVCHHISLSRVNVKPPDPIAILHIGHI